MTHDFDADYWESHWREVGAEDGRPPVPANPYVASGTAGLVPGTALDAGCGEGAEAIWLAEHGWQVTAADISQQALTRAADRVADASPGVRVTWVRADLDTWEPPQQYDLVTTHYAHPAMPQLAFYERLATWVAPGGTLLVVGHLQEPGGGHGHGHGHAHEPQDGHAHGRGDRRPPEQATVTAASVVGRLDPTLWEVVSADEPVRAVGDGAGELHDVVVRATRRAAPDDGLTPHG
ncbi:class I SAM-dependent methyltransferase [Nocardioides sp. P5_C9_2]